MTKMMAGKKGYRDIQNYSDDNIMSPDYFGLIARGDRYYIARYINVNEGRHITHEIDINQVAAIKSDWDKFGWSVEFIERWLYRVM